MREEGKGKELDAESEHHEMMRTMGGLEISKLEKIWGGRNGGREGWEQRRVGHVFICSLK